ncbi:hypothetical protein LJR230_004069 [Trinickia sp. LjRoot230]|uniref:PelD GGDEF domain-containing protein n=1 Tax=Trinickia sp. LjRoot230 TaxID=3342288 RepID=UPI003ECDE1B0
MTTASAPLASTPARPRYSNPFGNLGRLRRFIAPAVARPFAIVETIAFMLVVLALAHWLVPDDPLLAHSGFPWLWLAPLVIALRYGTLLGILGGALLAAGALLQKHGVDAAWQTPFIVGGLVQTIVAGHFGDTWGNRTARATALNDYLNDRLVALTNSHYLMRLSHERLEKDLLSKPTTLRDAITELRRLSITRGLEATAQEQGESGAMTGAQALLEFVAQSCQIDVAGLFPLRDGKVIGIPLAHIGEPFELDLHDELVTRALGTKQVAHLMDAAETAAGTQLLVCAPLVAADGSTPAVLAIKRMPFLSLNFENLQLLLVMLGYYADGVEHAALARTITSDVPDCPVDFALELGRLARLERECGIASSLVALVFPQDEAGDSLFEHVLRRRRSLDLIWAVRKPGASVIINLMPATDSTGVDGYLARIESSLLAQFRLDFESARVGVHTLHLTDTKPGSALARLLKRSGVDV